MVSIANSYKRALGWSGQLALLPKISKLVEAKFGKSAINKLLLQYGITDNFKNLTNSQAKYLVKFNSIDKIRNAFDETGFLQSGSAVKPSKQKGLSKVSTYERLADLANLCEKAKYSSYFNLAGEVEARNVQTRMNLTPAERKAKMKDKYTKPLMH